MSEGTIHKIIREAGESIFRPRARGPLTAPQFVVAVAQVMYQADPRSGRDVFNDARAIVREFLDDCGIEFGDRRYAWDYDAARTIAQEYWLAFAEPKP